MTEESPSGVQSSTSEPQRGRTMADEELERIAAKSASGDVLDPLALQDPVGKTVEKAILRVGIVVVVIFVIGILIAQVACKNITYASVVNLGAGVNEESVDRALSGGVLMGSDIVKFTRPELIELNQEEGTLAVSIEDNRALSTDELANHAMYQAFALAVNAFQDPSMQSVKLVARASVDADTGELSLHGRGDVVDVLTVTWTRSDQDPESFSCQIDGLDLGQTTLSKSLEGKDLTETDSIPAREIVPATPAA